MISISTPFSFEKYIWQTCVNVSTTC